VIILIKSRYILCAAGSLSDDKVPGNQVRILDGRATVSEELVSHMPLGINLGRRKLLWCASQET